MQDESYQLLQLVERVAAVFVNGSGWNPALGALGGCQRLAHRQVLWSATDPLPGSYGMHLWMLGCAQSQPG